MEGWMDGWMDGWKGGWKDGKAGLRIAYSNQKVNQKKISKVEPADDKPTKHITT